MNERPPCLHEEECDWGYYCNALNACLRKHENGEVLMGDLGELTNNFREATKKALGDSQEVS